MMPLVLKYLGLTVGFLCIVFHSNAKHVNLREKFKISINSTPACNILVKNSDALGSQETVDFAAKELKKYLDKICNSSFKIIGKQSDEKNAIILKVDTTLNYECYHVKYSGDVLELSGGSSRSVLYAVYFLLERLGCSWFAPSFHFYGEDYEYVPRKKNLVYFSESKNIIREPAFILRKLNIEEGVSHNVSNLRKIISWMPKLGFNAIVFPVDYRNNGNIKWEKWSDSLTEEIEKRDLIIEVGGHGYNNFINPEMPPITKNKGFRNLFEEHPEWFGRDQSCKNMERKDFVFNVENDSAVNFFLNNLKAYLLKHKEIKIFDLWPPDVARWDDCVLDYWKGSPKDRQAGFINKVDSFMKEEKIDVKIEIIAYGKTLWPPNRNIIFNENIIIDVCPIVQDYEYQIFENTQNNLNYVGAIREWNKGYKKNPLGIYSYYRKYAWRSLPNLLPHYIKKDLLWYKNQGLESISIYSEPEDWATYEINTFSLAKLAWNPELDVDSLQDRYSRDKFGDAWQLGDEIITFLEDNVRHFSSIPNKEVYYSGEISKVDEDLNSLIMNTNSFLKKNPDKKGTFKKLFLMLKYFRRDMEIQRSLRKKEVKRAMRLIENLDSFMRRNKSEGVFLIKSEKDLKEMLERRYRLVGMNNL